MSDVQTATAEQNRQYWEDRLGDRFGLESVGYIGLGRGFNGWMYRARRRVCLHHLAGLLRGRTDAEILDIGSGTGFYLDLWAELGNPATGSDITDSAVSSLRAQGRGKRVERFDAAGAESPFEPASFDIVSAFDVLFHIVDDDRYRGAIANIAGLLKPGGSLVFTDNFLHGQTLRAPTQASRSLAECEAAVTAAGLEVVGRRPAMFLMNTPVDSDSVAAQRAWRALATVASRSELAGWVAGAALYPLEVQMCLRRRESPTTEIMVARKPR